MIVKIKQLKSENDILKANITQLRTDNVAMEDKIGQLTTLLDKMAVNNQNQMQRINSQSSEIIQLRAQNQQIQVSVFST